MNEGIVGAWSSNS